ncbi:hypothetical protein AAKU64_000464 [Undibacterium sp. GrIS 1.8]
MGTYDMKYLLHRIFTMFVALTAFAANLTCRMHICFTLALSITCFLMQELSVSSSVSFYRF